MSLNSSELKFLDLQDVKQTLSIFLPEDEKTQRVHTGPLYSSRHVIPIQLMEADSDNHHK